MAKRTKNTENTENVNLYYINGNAKNNQDKTDKLKEKRLNNKKKRESQEIKK